MKDPTTEQGFTLIELVLVITVMAVAAIPLFSLFTQATTSLLDNEDLQVATQLAQEKAEQILGQRRNQGFAAVPAGSTAEPNAYGSFNRSIVVSQPAAGGCPGAATCKGVVIAVDNGGPALAEVTLLLVDY